MAQANELGDESLERWQAAVRAYRRAKRDLDVARDRLEIVEAAYRAASEELVAAGDWAGP